MTQPAGWYADPSGLPAQRWWDGGRWTDHIQPGGPPMPPPNGFFPPVPPSGPAGPGAHTVPSHQPLYVSQPAVHAEAGQPSRPVTPPAPHPEVPAVPYSMPPVDAIPPATATEPRPETALTGRQRTTGLVALALVAGLVLLLTAVILLGS
ncbi:DUF2510 domain-containing protein [Actinoplanes sp. G11-F43]|uniref:DUF2510 domain-containing protein n=1 Tax=Actinoplanes sp. G11-F43 TaxID=3424130 RepID=UPI003D32C87D